MRTEESTDRLEPVPGDERKENGKSKLKLKQLKPKTWGVRLSKRLKNDKKMVELNDKTKEIGEQVDGLMEVCEARRKRLIELEEENHRLRDENGNLKSKLDQIYNMVNKRVNNEPVDLNIVNDEVQLTAPVPIEVKAKPEDGEFPNGADEKSEPECMVSKEKESDEVLENENEESDHDESVPENAEENLEEQLIQQTEEVALIAISDTSFNSLHHSCKRCDFKSNQKAEFLEHMEKVHESEIRDACDVKLSKYHADDVLKQMGSVERNRQIQILEENIEILEREIGDDEDDESDHEYLVSKSAEDKIT